MTCNNEAAIPLLIFVAALFTSGFATSIDTSSELHIQDSICLPNQFMCHDGLKCVLKTEICDFESQCFDGSDEENCDHICKEFKCKFTGKCIPNGFLCDGVGDCGVIQGTLDQDLSDEQDPKCKSDKICGPNQYRCLDGVTCIDISELCDSQINCPINKDDEHKYCNDSSTICNESSNCKYGCKPSPSASPLCYCPAGKEHDGNECVESNVCFEEGSCDHECAFDSINKKKTCSCKAGYRKDGDTGCKANDVPQGPQGVPLVLYQDGPDLKWMNLNGSDASFRGYASSHSLGTQGLDFDHLNSTVCWISHSNISHVMQCAIGNNLNQFWIKSQPYLYSFEDVNQFAFDWISTNIYFIDEAHSIIFVCRENLTLCRTVIDTDISEPRGIALDPTEGFMFFTVWGRSGPKIMRALMDGSGRVILQSKKMVYPSAVTVDLAKSTVYWIDKFLDSIERIDYDGKNRRTIHRGVQLLQDIAVFENRIYYISMQDNSINSIDKFKSSSNNVTLKLKSHITKPMAMKIYHRVKQPRGKHPCKSHGQNVCQDFCFPFWDKKKPIAQCGCREGFTLQADGASCLPDRKTPFIVYTKSNNGIIKSSGLKEDPNSKFNSRMIPIIGNEGHSALSFDDMTQRIYYSDVTHFRILYKDLDKLESQVYIDHGIGYVGSIAVDWMGRNLYFVDESVPAIYVSRTDDSNVKKLLIYSNLTQPRSIALNPRKGLIYFSNNLNSIEQAFMDGTNRKLLVGNLEIPIGLTVDTENQYLYWVDSDPLKFNIRRIKLSSTPNQKPETFLSANSSYYGVPTDFKYFEGSIYLSARGKILRANAPTGKEIEIGKQLLPVLVNEDDVLEFILVDPNLKRGKSNCSGCQDLCLTVPNNIGYSCACRDGYVLNNNGKKCTPDSQYKSPLTCKPEEFQCTKFPKCISQRLLCNGVNECEDKSDENSQQCDRNYAQQGLCGANSFHCGNGTGVCIDLALVCDGKTDCPNDNSDENLDRCKNGTITCSVFEFQCKVSKRCIPRSWVCDSESDCGANDVSDEPDQCVYPECTVSQFRCANSTSCVPIEAICDGIPDCPGGEDETDCALPCIGQDKNKALYCEIENRCLTEADLCNGECDCLTGSDEINCPGQNPPACVTSTHDFVCDFDFSSYSLTKEECYNVSCGRHAFHCHNGNQCVPLWARCNGERECMDGSDENSCPKPPIYCPFPSRLCDNGTKCIGVNDFCNRQSNCLDKSDEGKSCSDSCLASSCSHNCSVTPTGPVCHCPPEMHVNPMNKSECVQTHPCDIFGTCSQICWKVGSKQFQCLCKPGYALKGDNSTCSSTSSEAPYLVFSNRHELRGLHLNSTSNFQSLISNLRNSIALDFYHEGNGKYEIFWSDVVDDRIYRGSLVQGSIINIKSVIQTGLSTAEGLAIDWIGGNIYWVESNLDQIEVAKLNGSFRETLISGDMVSPRSIAVDPAVGLLFWTDWETSRPRIERASMSGKMRTVIYNVGNNGEGAWPNGITLDYDLQRVFWVDARLDSIHTIKYDGNEFHTVLSGHDALSHPFSISLFESFVVWTDWRSNAVMRANKFNGENVTVIHKTYTQPFDVKILHASRQPQKIKNPCGVRNGNCSHLCLLSVNGTHDCGCPHLMTLGPDNRNCVANEKMILFSRLNEIRAVYFEKPYYHAAPPISYPLIVMPANLHFVAKYKQVYWSDSQSGETKRANIANPNVETLIDAAAGKPLAMGVDWISNLIFIAVQTPARNFISVTNLEGEFFTTIIQGKQDLRNVNSIAVDPYLAQIYWPDEVNNEFRIERANMDGTKRKLLTSSKNNTLLENPASLSYDFTSGRLYWINIGTENIQYYDFQTNVVKTLSFGDLKPHVITVYGDFIYFSSEKQDAILKGDKTLGDKYEFVRNNTENVYSIRIYDPEEQNGSNACAESNGQCQHLCLPLPPHNKVCKCALGYHVSEKDNTRCITMPTVLLFSDSHGIKGVSPTPDDQNELLIPIPLVSFATDIDVHEATDFIYWLDHEKGKISRIKRDGTSKQDVLTDLEASGLAIDWIAGNMYWANPKDSYIEIARLNGSSHYVLITEGLDKPVALAADPHQGYLFWTDVKGHIERSTLDGQNRKIIAENERASDIALDLDNKRLYLTDSKYDKIFSISYEGTDRKLIYTGTADFSHLHSPVVEAGNLFWIDIGQNGGSIMSTPVKNVSNFQAIKKNLGVTIKDLAIFSVGRQTGKNPCGTSNGGCGDLCFWNGTNANCFCAHGKLSKDGKSCEQFDAFIAYSRVSAIETVHVGKIISPNDPHQTIQSPEFIRNAIGLSYDYNRSMLFFSDVQLGTINSVFFNGTNFTIIAEKQGSVEGLYFEASHSDLYWTCSNDASINRINPHKKNAKIQQLIKLSSNDKPRGISVDPCESRVYFTNWDSNRPSIQRAYLSGYGLESIITTDIRMPNSLALDHPARKIYWVDARLDKIERMNLDGSDRRIILSGHPKHAFSIAVYNEYIIWSDWVRLAVMRASKFSGEDIVPIRKDIPKPMGLVAVFRQDETCTKNPCNVLNGGCSDKCDLDERGQVVCSCSPGKMLVKEDGRCVFDHRASVNCSSTEFACTSGGCIAYSLSCDGMSHCPDSSDELVSYCATRECKEGFSKCPSSNRCLPLSMESSCPGVGGVGVDKWMSFCTNNEWKCKNGECIKLSKRCNQQKDCKDHSDEEECYNNILAERINSNDQDEGSGFNRTVCSRNEFTCKNWFCIPSSFLCDQEADCSQGEDEVDCGTFRNSTKPAQIEQNCQGPNDYLCKNGVCIDQLLLCNKEDDCGDSSDEIACFIDECSFNVPFKVCDHICIDKKIGYNCECRPGWVVKPENPAECVDLNECTERKCSQVCENSVGSYKCSCLPGHVLQEDGQSCKSNSSYPPKVMFTNQYYIRMVDSESSATMLVAHNLTNAVALDYHWETGCIYWSDVTGMGSSIRRLCMNSSRSEDIGNKSADTNEKILHQLTLQSPDGLAIDWVAQNLYWCDKGTNSIEVSKLDGNYRKVLIEKLQDPRAIALDPFNAYLYWTDWGDEPIIGRAGMDGSRSQTLISDNLGWPNALCISYETNEIWWADAKEDYIAVADLNGKNMKIVHSRAQNPSANIHHIFSLTVYENYIYWSDWETKTIERCHKYTGENQTSITDKLIHRPMDVKVFHPYRQPPMLNNPCEDNGGCERLCLLTPEGGHVCACPEHFVLNPDMKTCRSNCTSAQFVCEKTSKCIPKWWWCDTQEDCEGGEDEPDSCPPFHCTPGQIQFNDTCLYPGQVCDGVKNEPHGLDEKDCDKHTCFSTQFKCMGNGTTQSICISAHQVCDGNFDCVLGQDEADCAQAKCPHHQFQCTVSKKCLQKEWLCDNENDCGNGDSSDEDFEMCRARTCDTNKFRCSSGKCVPSSWRCDGEQDCPSGEDELSKECEQPIECDPSYYRCSGSSKCVPSRWKCDFEPDCPNGDDERNCLPRNCSESEIKCGDGRCIHKRFQCDGLYQCSDALDELGCDSSCSANEFQCTYPPTCLPSAFRCDSEVDCSDGSDEFECLHVNRTDLCDGFTCKNLECISKNWVCDGDNNDCSENEDESPEMCATNVCEVGRFRCSNNVCVPFSKTCNFIDDCGDGSDEKPEICITHKPRSCNSTEYECADKKCISEKLVCNGIAECLTGEDEEGCVACPFGTCPQLCVVKKQPRGKPTHYTCECSDGYILSQEGNKTECLANGEPLSLLIASEDHLRRLRKPHDSQQDELIIKSSSNPFKIESVDYMMDSAGGLSLFWSSRLHKTIQRMFLPPDDNSLHSRKRRSNNGPIDLITGLDDPRGIAVDWSGKTIFWLDAGSKTISVSSLDGQIRMVLVNKHINEPYDIVVDPHSGRIFWSDCFTQRIDNAFMDGSGRKTIILSPCPTGLAIDYPAKRLYFTDIKTHTIESTTLEGKDRHAIKRFIGDIKPFKIDIFEDFVYVTGYNSNRIVKLNKFGRGDAVDISSGVLKTSDVLIVQQNKQPKYKNICETIQCPSPGLCLKNGSSTAICVCPNGRTSVSKGLSSSGGSPMHIFECNTTVVAVCDLKCKAEGVCVIESTGPKCKCKALYEGALCEVYKCSEYCFNKGLCYPDMAAMTDTDNVPLKCSCAPNYTGERCETKIGEECRSGIRCENGGICIKDKCRCPEAFSGSRCEKNPCENYCKNKGKCKVIQKNLVCNCLTGFSGNRCEDRSPYENPDDRDFNGIGNSTEIDLCSSISCQHHGTCVVIDRAAYCRCPDSWFGTYCEIEAQYHNPCQALCLHNGICLLGSRDEKPRCICVDNYAGIRCELKTTCQRLTCFNGGTCVPNPDLSLVASCRCPPNFHGVRCESRNLEPNFSDSSKEDSGLTWILVLVFILVALSVASISGCVAYLFLRRKGRGFTHTRMDSGTVEISNPMFMKDEGDDDQTEPSLIFDSDKVLLHPSNNFSNPVYETMYSTAKEGETSSANDEKKGLLQDHPLADPLA